MEQVARHQNRSGFTLVEIIIVILILGIMSAFVAVKFSTISSANLNSSVDVVKSQIRFAQSRAMNTNKIWGINISSTTQYSLFQNGSTADIVTLPGQETSTVTLPAGVAFASASVGIISFDTWGKPYTDAAGTAAQSGSRTISLTLGSDTKSISITQNTGFIP